MKINRLYFISAVALLSATAFTGCTSTGDSYGYGYVDYGYRSGIYYHHHDQPGYRPPGNRPPGNRPPGNRPPGKPTHPIARPPSSRPPAARPMPSGRGRGGGGGGGRRR